MFLRNGLKGLSRAKKTLLVGIIVPVFAILAIGFVSAPRVQAATATDTGDTCQIPEDTEGRYFSCMFLGWGQDAIEKIDKGIQKFLYTPPEQIFTPQMQTAWNSFRVIGVALILIGSLVMVVSQAFGMEIFDAYTVKKLLPRLVVAAIGISLSWTLLKFVIVLFNDLGLWAHDIILQPFINLPNKASDTVITGGVLSIIAVVGYLVAILGGFGSMALVGTVALALLVGFLVLAIRQLVILMAILTAPLAIAAYILPGTQKLWEFWKNTFLTALYMFPIIMGFIAAGKAMAYVASSVDDSPEMHLLAFLVYFAPYFMLPFAFKLAGGLMATIFSIANDRNRGAFDRLRKTRQRAGAQHRERTIGRQTLQARSDMAAALRRSASRNGRSAFSRGLLKGVARGVEGYNIEAGMSARREQVGKELNAQIATGQDDQIRALTVNKTAALAGGMESQARADGNTYSTNGKFRIGKDGSRQYQTLGGAWVQEADVDRAYSRWGKDAFAQQTALSYEMRKANSEEEVRGIAENYRTIAQGRGGWNMNDGNATGVWIGAAFENQGKHMEYKKTDWKSGKMGTSNYSSLVDEVYEKQGSYPLAQMHSHTIERLKEAHADAQQVIESGYVTDPGGTRKAATAADIARARDTQQKTAAIAETFMHSLGTQMGEADGVPIQSGEGATGRRTVSSAGAAHTAERVHELATMTGVLSRAPSGPYTSPAHGAEPFPRYENEVRRNNRDQ